MLDTYSKNGKQILMPTNTKDRLNISIVDQECIEELRKLRKSLETGYQFDDKQISFADIVKVLMRLRPSNDTLMLYF